MEDEVDPWPDGYPCPCCGHTVFAEPAFWELCPICFWEDDPGQLRWPESRWGANGYSLIEGQRNYATIGVSHPTFADQVRPASIHEPIAEGWRPLDPEVDDYVRGDGDLRNSLGMVPDPTVLYWWRSPAQ